MKYKAFAPVLFCLLSLALPVWAQTGPEAGFSGQLSVWSGFTPDVDSKIRLGARYLPQLDLHFALPDDKSLDFELSANLGADLALTVGAGQGQARIRPYRAWGRYAWATGEVRLGLQKINFGSAQILRPLMWFDSMDPRDPLQLTSGVWAALYRQYFNNNANLWLWTLAGNKDAKGWERFPSAGELGLEFGGRFQFPLPFGEAALTYHYRQADVRAEYPDLGAVPEHRLAFDLRADAMAGLWLETALTHYTKDLGPLTNQLFLTLGADYTFNVGNGLAVTAEHLLYLSGPRLFRFDAGLNVSALHFNYPLNMLDSLSLLLNYVWGQNKLLGSLAWQRQYDDFSLHVTAFWNPVTSALPGNFGGEAMAGKGIQFMLVWNH